MNKRISRREKIIFLLPAVFLAIVIFLLRKRLTHIFIPVIIALVLSYMLEPVVRMFQKKAHMKRNKALIITFALAFAILTVILVFLVPAVLDNLREIIKSIPLIRQRLDEMAERLSRVIGSGRENAAYNFLEKHVNKIMERTEKASIKVLEGLARSYKKVFNIFFDFVTAVILTYYFLKDKAILSDRILSFFPYDYRKTITETFYELGKISSGFLQGQILIAIIVGILETAGLFWIGVPYPVLLGIIGGFSNLIPYFGPFIGAIPAIVCALIVSPAKALWTALLYIGVQQLDNNFLGPKIIEGKLGIHPVTTIIVIFLGGELFGLPGVFLSVPIYAMLRCIVSKMYKSLLRKNADVQR